MWGFWPAHAHRFIGCIVAQAELAGGRPAGTIFSRQKIWWLGDLDFRLLSRHF
jgi:hypothetical protein